MEKIEYYKKKERKYKLKLQNLKAGMMRNFVPVIQRIEIISDNILLYSINNATNDDYDRLVIQATIMVAPIILTRELYNRSLISSKVELVWRNTILDDIFHNYFQDFINSDQNIITLTLIRYQQISLQMEGIMPIDVTINNFTTTSDLYQSVRYRLGNNNINIYYMSIEPDVRTLLVPNNEYLRDVIFEQSTDYYWDLIVEQ